MDHHLGDVSENELLQWAGVLAGGAVTVAVIFGIVKMMRSLGRLWPDAAQAFGLKHEAKQTGNAFGAAMGVRQTDVERLHGSVDGIRVEVIASSESAGNRKSSGTRVVAHAKHLAAEKFQFTVEKAPNRGAAFHVVSTGDDLFDRRVVLKGEAKAQVKALMGPKVREALAALPQSEAQVFYDQGVVVLSFGGVPWSKEELQAPIRAALALAQQRLGDS